MWQTTYVHPEKGLSRCEKSQDGLSQKEDMVFSLFSKKTTLTTIKSGIVHRIPTIRNLISNHSIYAKYLLNFTSPKPLLLVYFFL